MSLAVIVPVHNERTNIEPFYRRATAVLSQLSGLDTWAIVFVNDASEDGSLEEILRLRQRDAHVKVITLSRNFGYHAVLVAGLSQVESDLYAVVDVDCEDPPELLEQFYAAIREGFSVAYGIRSNRQEPRLITFCRKMFYQTMRRIADAEIVDWMAEFAMITTPVRNAILLPHTTYPFLRAEIGYVGFKRIGVPYVRGKREHGRSHYNLFRMTKFAIGGLLSSSTFPLRLILYAAAAIGLAFPLSVWAWHLSTAQTAVLAAVVSLYFVLVALPLISLYLARTYKNLVSRPVFVVDQERTFLDASEGAPGIMVTQPAAELTSDG